MSERFPLYTTDYISGVMSLRTPQTASLKILEEITSAINLRKGMNLTAALGSVCAMYPTCMDFERDFMSLTFALATGVGKTRLMGAFIAYLYTQHNIRNYFVVAPNTTIYDKLKKDLSDWNSPKYVFKGLGCFSAPPQIITDSDYKDKTIPVFQSDIRIFIYNIDKFNKENAEMRKIQEMIGRSFYEYLSQLPDLVLIMDESHHYRAEKGAQALNDLHPLLGLELTATPLVTKGNKQVPFKNVVYEYPLSQAIEDGYTRTPFAVTRSDIDFYNFGNEQLDKLMLLDGITCHENAKRKLKAYAINNSTPENPIPIVKPFMLVVCQDTAHAEWVERFIKSDEFREGAYRGKTITVHSKQKGAESEANTRLLLDVENPDNPVEIVIHVNMLKEGWDVNNLYTIVPLRTAASKILREQLVGRGLRLPYGKRTGDKDVDVFMDFDLDMAEFTHAPIQNILLIQDLIDPYDRQRIQGDAIDFEGYNPKKVILEKLREKPEIDYERCSALLFKLITQVCEHYELQYGTNGMQNIVMMYRKDIAGKIYNQMMQHFYCENGLLQEEVIGTRNYNLEQQYGYKEKVGLFDNFTADIRSVLFIGIRKGVFDCAKFDSKEGELTLAQALERDPDVLNWLRPSPQEFNITYNHGKHYEPDFVVETETTIYLVEVKGEDKLNDPGVISKKKRGIQYCEVATRWGKANGYKAWKYLFIPSKQVQSNSSFLQLVKRFEAL